MSKDDFVARWKHEIAGLTLFGHVGDVKGRAASVFDVPALSMALLERMYVSLQPPEPAAPDPSEGIKAAPWELLVSALVARAAEPAVKTQIVATLRDAFKEKPCAS